jgi:tetratricopeptide (TPR) repeat protein
MNASAPGKVVTFYSYKGGTGRSMALANTAWILASNGKRVLAVDWDLESPGLHRYFHPFLVDRNLRSFPGVVDLVWDFANSAMESDEQDDWVEDRARIERYAVSLDRDFGNGGLLDFVSAGSVGPDYGIRVSNLNWEVIYDRQGGGTFIEKLRDDMRAHYDYALIDSRTGLSDTAGICTVALPDIIVNCFTLSTQSIDGAVAVARSVRELSDRDIRLMPVPMRVEDAEKTKLEAGRDYARSCFAPFLASMSHDDQERYWGDVEVPYKTFYAYEEILATIGDRPRQENTLLASYERIAADLTHGEVRELQPMPEPERRRRLAEFERTKLPVASDIFISHAEQDRMWAEWIAHELEVGGYRVVTQGPDFPPGADVRTEIERTVSAAACTIVILTPDYVESAHARITWDAALNRDPMGNLGLLLPVKVNQFRPLGLFASRVPIDLVGLSADQAREELLASMREPSVTPVPSDSLPTGLEPPRFPGLEPDVFRVPTRNPNFVGRDALLLKIRAQLASSLSAAVLPQTLHGLGGVGKTQVALEYAHRFAPNYDLVWWVPADQIAEARSSLTDLAPHLGITPSEDAADTLRQVTDALRRGEPFRHWLLIFDNADDTEEIQELWPHGGMPHESGHLLITSRNHEWSEIGDTVEVDVFTRDESLQLLERRGRNIPDAEADRLADRLGDLPLAIEQAAVWQAETGMPVPEYLELFDEQLQQLLDQGLPRNYTNSVAATWGIAFSRLQEQSPAALQLLELCAFFGPEPIPFRILKMGRYAPSLPDPLATTISDTILRRRAVREIGRYALARVDPGQDTLVVHRLVQDVLRDRLLTEDRERFRASAHELLAASNPGNADNNQNWPQHAELSPHVVPSGAIDSEKVETRKVVLDQVRYRYRRGDFEGSRELAEKALDSWSNSLGPDHQQTLEVSYRLSDALWWLGEGDEVQLLRKKTLERMERVLGPDHELTLITANGRGGDLRVAGKFAEALALDRQLLDRHRNVFGEDDPNTLRSANNLAADLRLLGDFGAARELDEDTLGRRRKILREWDDEILSSVASVARDLLGLGDYAGARTLLAGVTGDFRRMLGPGNNEVLRSSRTFTVAVRKAGDVQEARLLVEASLNQHRLRFGEAHLDTLAVMTSAGHDRRTSGDLEAARSLSEQVLEGYRRRFPDPEHPFTYVAMTNLALVARAQGDVAGARSLDEQALAGLERALGRENPFSLCVIGNLASDLSALHEHADALQLSEELVELSTRVRGELHPYTLGGVLNLALDLKAMGPSARAEELLGRVKAQFDTVLGSTHPEAKLAGQEVRAEFDIEPPDT